MIPSGRGLPVIPRVPGKKFVYIKMSDISGALTLCPKMIEIDVKWYILRKHHNKPPYSPLLLLHRLSFLSAGIHTIYIYLLTHLPSLTLVKNEINSEKIKIKSERIK